MTNCLGRKLSEGSCSEVYEWNGSTQIVKLAKPNTSIGALKQEYANTLAAWQHGLPAVRPLGFVEVEGRPGVVFERIYGESMLDQLLRQLQHPEPPVDGVDFLSAWTRTTAGLLHEIHCARGLALPDQRSQMISDIRRPSCLTHAEKEAVIVRLQRLPRNDRVCHGDPNPGNIMFHNGRSCLIDWNDASIGNPEADVAECILTLQYAQLPAYVPQLADDAVDLTPLRKGIADQFVREYGLLTGISAGQLEEWLVPAAARRLTIEVLSDYEERALLELIRSRL